MTTRKRCDVIPLFPPKEEIATVSGWDPYIFAILAKTNKSYAVDRRRTPRPLTAVHRRALLMAQIRKPATRN